MTEFDPVKSQQEVVTGISRAHRAFVQHARATERKLAEAEAEHNAALLMEASSRTLVEFEQTKLKALIDKAEREAGR